MVDSQALLALGMLLVLLLASVGAPWYAQHVSQTDPFRSNVNGEVVVDGQRVAVIQASTEGLGLGQTPIGPTWRAAYLLGADNQGRD
ncbi:MAG: ABC transporter permease, partial [Chitinophagaceae bacterium]|nr:ABC transporter permease [Rubrivivax sp.]